MHSPHMILEVPLSRESVSKYSTVASFVCTKIGLITMTMHGVRFALVAEQTGSGRKLRIFTRLNLTTIGLKMRVDKFTAKGEISQKEQQIS